MTNEEIAMEILSGSPELCPLLWEKVEKYLYSRSRSFYSANRARCDRAGVQLEDIKQECYFVFRKALHYWRPETGYSFITFLNLPFKKACRELLGISTTARDTLNYCESLDRPASADDSEGTTLEELQPDPQSTEFLERIEAAGISEQIRAEVATLPEREQTAIEYSYFRGAKLNELGAVLGVSYQRAREIRVKAERHLRANKTLRHIYYDFYKQRYKPRHNSRNPYFAWQPEHFEEIRREQARAAKPKKDNSAHKNISDTMAIAAELAEMRKLLRELTATHGNA